MAKTAYAVLIIRKLEGQGEERTYMIDAITGKRFESRTRGAAAAHAFRLSMQHKDTNYSVVKVRCASLDR